MDDHDRALVIVKYSILFEVFFFNIFGLFGNAQILWITCRKNSTHTKPGILLAINAVFHIICLLSEVVNVSFILSGHVPTRRLCYSYITVYVFSICQQVFITLLMGIDLLIALLFPLWYRKCSNAEYLLAFLFIATTYSLPITVWGFIARDDEVIPFCNPPLGLAPHVSVVWSMSNIVINSVVVLVYAAIIIVVRIKAKNSSHETRRVIRRLRVTVVVFIVSWYMAILGVNIGYAIGLDKESLFIWQSNMVIFALLCYSQTFYVCLWRSKEYRLAFMEQLYFMIGRVYPKSRLAVNASSAVMFVKEMPKAKTVQ